MYIFYVCLIVFVNKKKKKNQIKKTACMQFFFEVNSPLTETL